MGYKIRRDTMQKGERFNRLTYLGESRKQSPGDRYFGHFQCDCGKRVWQPQSMVKSGRNKSCGCYTIDRSRAQLTIHGKTGTPEFSVWAGMRNRCRYACVRSFRTYGGKGIKVCERWDTSFENFLADIGLKPFPDAQLDRIDSDGDYEPSNVRWTSSLVNAHNKASVIKLTVGDETRPLSEWAQIAGISHSTIYDRLKRGMAGSDAVFLPADSWKTRRHRA